MKAKLLLLTLLSLVIVTAKAQITTVISTITTPTANQIRAIDTFKVNATYDATVSSIADTFSGSTLGGNVAISGTVAPDFYDISMKQSGIGRFRVLNPLGIKVHHSLYLDNGFSYTNRSLTDIGAIHVLSGATCTGSFGATYDDFQYVNGYVSKTGSNGFTFPVGSQNTNDVRLLTISAPATPTTTVAVAYWRGDVGSSAALDPTGGPHSRASLNTTSLNGETLVSVSPIGFWDWIPVAGTDNMTITVSLPGQSATTGNYTNATKIRLVGWNDSLSKWELLGNSGASSLAEDATLSGSTNAYPGRTMASYSAIGWGSITQTPLPVNLVSFSGTIGSGGIAQLSWQTASERDVKDFSIEYSTDGVAYRTIGEVAARNAATGSTYQWSWAGIQPGKSYFRLRVIDNDGSSTFSKIVPLSADGSMAITASPNPVTSAVTVSGLSGTADLALYNAAGMLLHRISTSAASATIPMDSYPAGAYTIQVIQGGKLLKSFNIQK